MRYLSLGWISSLSSKFLQLMGPYQGFRDLGRRAIYFQGSGKQVKTFGVLGSRDLRKNILGIRGERSFFSGS